MDKQQLINRCKYYKGEEKCPHKEGTESAMFWFYESKWVEMSLTKAGKEIINCYVSEYNAAGLYDFEKRDGTPQNLKALLFNRYTHLNGDYPNPPEFRNWYLTAYKGNH